MLITMGAKAKTSGLLMVFMQSEIFLIKLRLRLIFGLMDYGNLIFYVQTKSVTLDPLFRRIHSLLKRALKIR